MKNKVLKWWILIVISVPFVLMLCLHIGIAFGNYFGININVPNVDASTWFIFSGSYFGGTMTLAGVMITLKYESSIHQYEKSLENIDKEKDNLGKAICELNVFAPSTLYQRFNSLHIAKDGYNPAEVASIRQQLADEMQKINKEKLETMFFTDIYAMTLECSACKKPCKIQKILPEFQKLYEKIGSRIFNVLQMIDSYADVCQRNESLRAWIANYKQHNQQRQLLGQPLEYDESEIKGYENKIVNVESQQKDIYAAIVEVSNYNQNEIQELSALAREYVAIKQQNAHKKCFPSKEE